MPKGKKNKTSMDKLTSGYEKFIEGKELNPKGKSLFDKTLKKAVKPRKSK